MTQTPDTLTLADRIELFRGFWAGSAPRPLLGVFYPARVHNRRYPRFDFDLSPAELVEKTRTSVAWHAASVDDRVPTAQVEYGTGFLTALAGGQFHADNHTAWTIPVAESCAAVRVAEFDEGQPLWQGFLERLRALRDAGIDEAILCQADMTGPTDILAGLVGTEQLCLDMATDPDSVQRALADCTRLWLAVQAAQVREIGLSAGGSACGFRLWLPGVGSMWSEDFTALIGPDMFERFARPCDAAMAQALDSSIMHIHSAGGRNLEVLAGIDALTGVEISNDPNGPPLEQLVAWGRMLQQAGKSIMMSNWNKPITDEQVAYLLENLDHRRLLITLQCRDEAQAHHYARWFRGA